MFWFLFLDFTSVYWFVFWLLQRIRGVNDEPSLVKTRNVHDTLAMYAM